jgi:hypothetical protein
MGMRICMTIGERAKEREDGAWRGSGLGIMGKMEAYRVRDMLSWVYMLRVAEFRGIRGIKSVKSIRASLLGETQDGDHTMAAAGRDGVGCPAEGCL